MPTEKEKNQKIQEKYQAILTTMLRDDDNKYCVDCDAKGPRWASWNIGVFLCIRCAGIHRNLGVHISKVKSVNLDQWTAEQIASMQAMGNSKGRAVYEANLPDNYRRPQSDQSLEQFIRAKYEQRRWIAKEWIPPNITISPDLTDEEPTKDKRKSVNAPAKTEVEKKPVINVAKPNSVNVKPPQPATPEKKVQKELIIEDLLGLDDIPSTKTSNATSAQQSSNVDIFGDFISTNAGASDSGWEAVFNTPATELQPNPASQPTSSSNNSISQNLINTTDDDLSLKSVFSQQNKPPSFDKDSILRLYNNQPTNFNAANMPQVGQQMFAPMNFGAQLINPQMPAQQFNAGNFQQNNMIRPTVQNNQAFNNQLNNLQMQMNNMNINNNNNMGTNAMSNVWPNQNQMPPASMPNLFNTLPTNNGFPNSLNSSGNTLSTNLWQ